MLPQAANVGRGGQGALVRGCKACIALLRQECSGGWRRALGRQLGCAGTGFSILVRLPASLGPPWGSRRNADTLKRLQETEKALKDAQQVSRTCCTCRASTQSSAALSAGAGLHRLGTACGPGGASQRARVPPAVLTLTRKLAAALSTPGCLHRPGPVLCGEGEGQPGVQGAAVRALGGSAQRRRRGCGPAASEDAA